MDLGLDGVHVLITGASGGIGLETARLFLTLGARVCAQYNTSAAALRPLVEEFSPLQIIPERADLTDEAQVRALFHNADGFGAAPGDANACTLFGPVHVLVVCHGIWPQEGVPISQMSLERWRATTDADLTSVFLVVREFLRLWEERKKRVREGRSMEQEEIEWEKVAVVLVGSTAGKFGEAGHADYAASKAALQYGFLRTLKNEITRIVPQARANCVAPGWVRTPMVEAALADPQIVYRALATTPLRKVATPQDVAHQIVLLASSRASGHVTGQVVMVDGGMEGRLLNAPSEVPLPPAVRTSTPLPVLMPGHGAGHRAEAGEAMEEGY